jgi:hypothetical protein
MLKSVIKFITQLLTNPELSNLNWDEIQHFFVDPDASCFALRGLTPNEHAVICNVLQQLAPAGTVSITYDSKGRPILRVRRENLEVVSSGEGKEPQQQS